MAARTVKISHDAKTRAKIKTSQLLNRLNDHVFNDAMVSNTQMKAIEILLRKTLPDLSAIEHTGADGGPIEVRASKEQRDAAISAALRSADS
jgi:hypothetical protein